MNATGQSSELRPRTDDTYINAAVRAGKKYIFFPQTIGEFLPKSDTESFENERYVVESRQKISNSLVSEVTLTVQQKAVKILDRLVGVRELQVLVELKTPISVPQSQSTMH
ncbi:hypothetical protein RRG08_065092 [Elysia crispata]|uniref:Uncharacterized protein n=1 Tax=Elysia crispata TaxID=231223 RepID=A0AAE0XMP4_9GAST|nr:hypothetical protein RRG08_065092 [Elysia crispata]